MQDRQSAHTTLHGTATTFTAVLLAGGKSTRMGRDKAALPWRGRALWEHQLQTLMAVKPDELLISGQADGPFAHSGVSIVTDEAPDLGPLAGIAASLRRASFELVLVLAVDLPMVSASFLTRLIDLAVREGRGVVPRNAARFEPLAAVYRRECLDLIEEHLRSRDRALQRFVREAIRRKLIIEQPLTAHEEHEFRNLNTEAEWRAATT